MKNELFNNFHNGVEGVPLFAYRHEQLPADEDSPNITMSAGIAFVLERVYDKRLLKMAAVDHQALLKNEAMRTFAIKTYGPIIESLIEVRNHLVIVDYSRNSTEMIDKINSILDFCSAPE